MFCGKKIKVIDARIDTLKAYMSENIDVALSEIDSLDKDVRTHLEYINDTLSRVTELETVTTFTKAETSQKDAIVDEKFDQLLEEIGKLTKRLDAADVLLAGRAEEIEKKDSNAPYIKIISERFTQENGLELTLDWNDAMIAYLRTNGYHGADEEEIAQQYISDIFNKPRNYAK